jgi:uncharacterized membrane protein YdbT with pleckstrin-like domain
MGYVSSNLLGGEHVTHWGNVHWIVLARQIPPALFGAGCLAAGALMTTLRDVNPLFPMGGVLVGLGVLFLTFLGTLAAFFRRWFTETAVTNKRVIVKMGFISRSTLELNLAKVETVQVHQSLGGRILGYGDIVVIGTGGTREVVRDVRDPVGFRKAVNFQQEHAAGAEK